MCAPGAGDDAQFNFRLPELGGVRGNYEIAHHGQFAATTKSVARNGCNDRLATTVDPLPVLTNEVSHVDIHIAAVLHPLNIGTSRKCLLITGDHQGANTVICLKSIHGVCDFIHQIVGQGIERLGSVEGNQSDVVPRFDENVLVIHGGSLRLLPMWAKIRTSLAERIKNTYHNPVNPGKRAFRRLERTAVRPSGDLSCQINGLGSVRLALPWLGPL